MTAAAARDHIEKDRAHAHCSYREEVLDQLDHADLRALRERLTRAEHSLRILVDEHPGWSKVDFARISGKSDGIRLALSYVEEALR